MALEDMYGDSEEELTNTEKAAILFIALALNIRQSSFSIWPMMKLNA